MSTRFKGCVLLAILVSTAGVAPAFASPYSTQNLTDTNSTLRNTFPSSSSSTITVTTDKPSYGDGDKVTISGSTKDYISGTPVTVIVRNPIGNVIKVDHVALGTDKTYSTSIMAGGSLWQAAGTYSVLVEFGSKDRSATTTFQFAGSGGGPTTIKVEGTDFSVAYSITNGKVLGIKADVPAKSLMVSIETYGNGVLTITLPRGLIDSKMHDNQTDDPYVLLNDDQENTDFQETTTTQTDRTLSIPFENGTTQIEIIGT